MNGDLYEHIALIQIADYNTETKYMKQREKK